ncbi:thioesterase family protein [Nocardioides nitrophenolicus]|uniref:thioesterase family protein n=1 Tax=Nocardioides nitrophenolicus TaxID=60489 RepID=UPI00195958D7|nr:hotdog domain-containing protein [Nocardioides nitrophenolicus]MBM7516803.1 putative thioesterase [Nocardioides nitrophenolicus]
MTEPSRITPTATLARPVTAADTARAFGAAFPEAAATPFVLGLAEVACHEAVASELADGQITVGVAATVSHRAPTPVGETLTAVATETSRSGRRRTFRVVVTDGVGECAVVEHERAIVDAEQVAARLRDRSVR